MVGACGAKTAVGRVRLVNLVRAATNWCRAEPVE